MAHALIDDQDGSFQGTDLTGTGMVYRDQLVRYHRLDRGYVFPGRQIVDVPGHCWPAPGPEHCTDPSFRGCWFDGNGRPISDICDPDAPEGVVLLCVTCGLDCT
ncbi:hypothetical protein [Alloactinosynnema sp. L-07]|uniref:hypothetical protein n=1 Tax=Alloactinosynnema sp. L-07 TaxID=1653480 RepID=UPI0006B4AC7B|nr:hypothetical protein [Alloactinosynnema sp. L-07]